LKDKLLITGGAGYIGSVISSYFLDRNYQVNIIDDLSSGSLDNIDQRAVFFKGSILDTSLLRESMQGVTTVLHFAAKSLVGESVSNSDLYYKVNIQGTKNILDQMKVMQIDRIVFSSTCAVYGQPKEVPISEKSTTDPISPYGISKLKADELLTEIAESDQLAALSFRFFNISGSYMNSLGRWVNESRQIETHLIPNLLHSVNGTDFKVFGLDYPTPDGSCIRDYLHVIDLARAYELALGHLKKSEHRIINLGSGVGRSVLEIIAITEEVVGSKIEISLAKSRAGDPAILVADIELAKKLLDWQPEFTAKQIIQSSWEGFSEIR
jgi:UDP-glucose 4-epimerase